METYTPRLIASMKQALADMQKKIITHEQEKIIKGADAGFCRSRYSIGFMGKCTCMHKQQAEEKKKEIIDNKTISEFVPGDPQIIHLESR